MKCNLRKNERSPFLKFKVYGREELKLRKLSKQGESFFDILDQYYELMPFTLETEVTAKGNNNSGLNKLILTNSRQIINQVEATGRRPRRLGVSQDYFSSSH